MTNSAYSMILWLYVKKKNIRFQSMFNSVFWVQTVPVKCINGKSLSPKKGGFQEQHIPCPRGGYRAVNSRSKTLQTGSAWDFSVENGTAPLWSWGNLFCYSNTGLTVNNLAAIKIRNFFSSEVIRKQWFFFFFWEKKIPPENIPIRLQLNKWFSGDTQLIHKNTWQKKNLSLNI